MRLLVKGGSVFVGEHCVKALLADAIDAHVAPMASPPPTAHYHRA
jgi:uncharacterized protein YbjT (DUF2867 family)